MLACDFEWLRRQAQEDEATDSILKLAVQALNDAANA